MGADNVVREFNLIDEIYTYDLALRQCDPEVIRAEAVRLYDEVISDYADVPYITRIGRRARGGLERSTSEMERPTADGGRPSQHRKTCLRKKTLGQQAEARLDDMLNLAVGKPAPEIEGVDMDGKPLKLSDHKGKVVVLVFWGTWCGPCMARSPRARTG